MNVIRIEEIYIEINKIETDREDAEQCINELQQYEEVAHEDLRKLLANISYEFETYHGDKQLTNLAEEKYTLLLKAEQDCSDFIKDLYKERNVINEKCESDIEKLKQELQSLEAI